MNESFHLLPAAASTAATRVDWLFLVMLLLTGGVALTLAGLMVFFSVRYRKGSSADRRGALDTEVGLEIGWTVVPLILFLGLFTWAAYDYSRLYRVPDGAMPVFVVAKQWMWTLEHANGRREIDELHVPLGQPVRVVMTSQDVIHSFFVPAFRIKQDVVPGRYTSVWFTATRPGTYELYCAEYCGTEHSVMRGRIVVMQAADFAQWLQSDHNLPGIAARGFALFRRYGCSGCHAAGSSVHAPDLDGLLGRPVHLQDGRTVIADENYVRDSILLPRKDIVAGYEPIMPSYAGQIDEEDLLAIIQYLRQTERDHAARP